MARETLRDFLSSIGSGKSSISYNVRDDSGDGSVGSGDDLGVDPSTGKELLKLGDQSKGLLGDYLSFIQKNSNVIFNVAPGNTEAVSAVRGNPLESALDQGAENVFIDVNDSSEGSINLNRVSNSSRMSTLIDKTQGTKGHYLLNDIEGADTNISGKLSIKPRPYPPTPEGASEKELVNLSVEVMREDGRFYPAGAAMGKAFAKRYQSSDVFDESDDKLTVQRDFGDYSDIATAASLEQLKRIGKSLLSQAARISDSQKYPEKNLTSIEPTDKVDPSDLMAKNADGFPTTESGDSSRIGRGEFISLDATDSSKSFGSLTDVDHKFDTVSDSYMKARAAVGIKAAVLAIKTFSNLAFQASKGESDGINGSLETGMGVKISGKNKQYVDEGTSFIMSSLLIPTRHSYERCVRNGLKYMFSIDNMDKPKGSKNSDVSSSKLVSSAPGYSVVLARSIFRSVEKLNNIMSTISSGSAENSEVILMQIARSGIIGFLNSLARVGDIRISRFDSRIRTEYSSNGPWDVDNLPDGPSTRVSKSRTSDGFNSTALSMRTSATPSAYVLPLGPIRAAIRMGTGGIGVNPAKGMLVSSISKKTFFGPSLTKSGNGPLATEGRIPPEVVRRVEDMLDAEYVPFYFHDIRTNEIIAFHAFLDSLSDGFNAEYSATSGYGRMDPVQTYKSTSRTIGFSFHVVATSEEDFDEMWFKINKLVTLVYPQWTKGDLITDGTAKFIQPFSQVIGATPLIRLRIGDVIKSNYSKFNLSRMFGTGEPDTKFLTKAEGVLSSLASVGEKQLDLEAIYREAFLNIFAVKFGSPISTLSALLGGARNIPAADVVFSAGLSAASKFLDNGFASWSMNAITNKLIDPVRERAPDIDGEFGYVGGERPAFMPGAGAADVVFIKGTTSKGYLVTDGISEMLGGKISLQVLKVGDRIRFSRPVKAVVISRKIVSSGNKGISDFPGSASDSFKRRTIYTVELMGGLFDGSAAIPYYLNGVQIEVSHSDIIPDPNDIFNRLMLPFLDPIGWAMSSVQEKINSAAGAIGIPGDTVNINYTHSSRFMVARDNAIVKSFDSTKGRGLAGVIDKLSFNWIGDEPWEIDWGSRAPKVCKIDVGFRPIHDLPPGIDHEGFNRAPVYNVGKIMRYVAGDPYDDNGESAKREYEVENKKTFKLE